MDTHLYAGYEVPPFYDSLLGKLIAWGPDRATAIARGRAALDELVVDGLITNVAIHQALLANQSFLDGRMTTNLLDRVGSAAFLAAAARAEPAVEPDAALHDRPEAAARTPTTRHDRPVPRPPRPRRRPARGAPSTRPARSRR